MNANLISDFREMRRVSTPIVCVQTQDHRAVMRELLTVRRNGDEEPPPSVVWNCINGPRTLSGDPPSIGTSDDAPSMVLRNALALDEGTILFLVVPDTCDMPGNFWSNPYVAQAAANLRDPFKSNRRTLVILSLDGKLPPLIANDVPLLVDPLPEKDELLSIAEKLAIDSKAKVKPEDLGRAASLCLGMTRFAAEEAISRKLRKSGIDLAGLALTQREVIEQSSERGLMFERGSETFDDIGGQENIKMFSSRLFKGSRPPTCIVRIEEIEKAMAGSGSLGDTSGVSQDQLGVMLTCMEDNDWTGYLAVGAGGTGKSLISKATGNTYKVPTLVLDLGACKGQYVGASEQKVRKVMAILKTFAGSGALFIATCNGLETVSVPLRRRFRFGIFYFDLPTESERKSIWTINLCKFGLPGQTMPDDRDFTGSDIRNVCDLASRLSCSLVEACNYIVPVAKSDPAAIAKLRDAAHGKFLSANCPGPYQKPEAKTNRTIAL